MKGFMFHYSDINIHVYVPPTHAKELYVHLIYMYFYYNVHVHVCIEHVQCIFTYNY